MRYTLRLLTLQQFQRASALICACEMIRREALAAGDTRWGTTPFRIGLWVGQRTTPNATDQADEAIKLARGAAPKFYGASSGSPAQITNCPWCGTAIDPGRHIRVELPTSGRGRTVIYCGDALGQCPFGERQSPGEGLPLVVVDEEIYRLLPSLLIATVDKFAQMPWKGATAMLFGRVSGRCTRHGFRSPEIEDSDSHPARNGLPRARTQPSPPLRPPDLIIQDELHLISGPLGTLVGLYEAAVDILASWDVNGQTVRPKVIASTATIRQARDQVHSLFMRRVEIFPPQGLDAGDNFFALQRPVAQIPGRRYIGICAPGRRLEGVLIRVYVAYLAGAQSLYEKYGAAVDPWMTLVAYFNSMRELGGTRRLVDDDIRMRLQSTDRRGLARRYASNPRELTSRVSSQDIPGILDQLELPFDGTSAKKAKRDETASSDAMVARKALKRYRVGDMRPSQILYAGGVGAIIDLPRLSGLIMGLDDWDVGYAKEIGEDRLLATVRAQEGLESVARLMSPPVPQDGEGSAHNPFDSATVVGVPVAPFPRWLLCPWRRLLAPLDSGLFKLKVDRYRPDRTSYVHENCPNTKRPPVVLASRFMVACPVGHLDDFPWRLFVHKGPSDCKRSARSTWSRPSRPTPMMRCGRLSRRGALSGQQPAQGKSLRTPEWEIFATADPKRNSTDFRLKPVAPPQQFRTLISQVVLVERLRQVQALIGFTRIESPGDLADVDDFPPERRAPLARKSPSWAPATEVRGEGIFLRFNEETIRAWELSTVAEARARELIEANRQWRTMRGLDPNKGFPGIRYVLLHSFAHALMRQMVLECGYNAASVRERIYALPPEAEDGPMAGILIYTAAPDSEGTLGGLVSLGYPDTLGRHVEAALERVAICASDPYCSEHNPQGETVTLHGAACHSCMFVPETSCERGNRFLDRSVLAETIIPQGRAFFASR